MNIDGSGVRELIPGTAGYYYPTWSPDGSRIFVNYNPDRQDQSGFVEPDAAAPTFVPLAVGLDYQDIGSTRKPSTLVPWPQGTSDRQLAEKFEPVLRFDSSESWRPLNVDSFFAESQHYLCDANAANLPATGADGKCEPDPMTSSADLSADDLPSAYIKIAPDDYSSAGDESHYHSPFPECQANNLRDCDAGALSSIYWGTNSDSATSQYKFIDYWFFYRANYFSAGIAWHEGDWEGVTIAPSSDGSRIDYAAFSQHGTYNTYLGGLLRCEDTPAGSVPAPQTCAARDSAGSGHRVDVMVANGDHANYTTPCSETIALVSCQSNNFAGLYRERGYDGTQRWGNAFDRSALLAMPPGASSWPLWLGQWGTPGQVAFGDPPRSPGQQAFSFQCAIRDNVPVLCSTPPARGNTAGDPEPDGAGNAYIASRAGSRPRHVHPRNRARPGQPRSKKRGQRGGSNHHRRTRAARSRRPKPLPGLAALSCTSWIGPGVSAVACDPARLRRAVARGHLGRHGSLVVFAPGRGQTAAGDGISQYTGRVENGSLLRLRGVFSRDALLLVRVRKPHAKHPVIAVFRVGRWPRRVARAAATSSGARLRLRLGARGLRRGISLGGMRPVQVVALHH